MENCSTLTYTYFLLCYFQEKQKFRSLCAIVRVSVALQQHQCVDIQKMAFSHSHGGFKLVYVNLWIC
jgi:hypothetical protein